MTLIFGALRDKDAAGMLAPLAARARRVILTASSSPRAAAPDELRADVPAGPASVETVATPAEALARAESAPRTPILCVAGSLSLIGDVLRLAGGGGDNPCPIEKPADSMGSLS
jgi:dihydrofolate synthase / folylpolyglutamate synthase